jgi:hypothetical protein
MTKDAAFPQRIGEPGEVAAIALSIGECPMINGSILRLERGQRFATK